MITKDKIKTVKVGHFSLEVTKLEPKNTKKNFHLGEVCLKDLEIRIAENLKESVYVDTLIHEVVHAVLQVAGIEDTEERVIKATSSVIQTAIDNPDLLELLLQFAKNKSTDASPCKSLT